MVPSKPNNWKLYLAIYYQLFVLLSIGGIFGESVKDSVPNLASKNRVKILDKPFPAEHQPDHIHDRGRNLWD